MKIAQVAPLWEQVPPQGYGGVELIVAHLTNQLIHRGHEVTLFASGDSQTLAKLEAVTPKALRLDSTLHEPGIYEILQLKRVIEKATEFDLIHFHCGFGALPFVNLLQTPVVHTLHGRFTEHNKKLFNQYRNQNYISISNAQQQFAPKLNYARTVYNGIDPKAYPFYAQVQEPAYLAFLGRLSPEKGPQFAIEVARKTGLPLKMAGKIDKVDTEFFSQEIKPKIDGKQIQYLGEVSHAQKADLIGKATLTLFPITWDEPFGLVMIESMCSGTPVVALNRGSVPEVIAHQETGYICNSLEEMVAAIPEAMRLSRQHCRDHVLSQFSMAQMVKGYEDAYYKIIDEWMSTHNGYQKTTQLSNLSMRTR